MTQTTNYGLSQWEKADRIQMENFNSDNAKIDAALKASADAVAAVTAAAGNCCLEVQSYTGTGTFGSDNPTQITFTKKPLLFIILGSKSLFMGTGAGASYETNVSVNSVTDSNYSGTSIRSQTLTWSGNTASITTSLKSADFQFNTSDRVYRVFAFYTT